MEIQIIVANDREMGGRLVIPVEWPDREPDGVDLFVNEEHDDCRILVSALHALANRGGSP